MIGQKMIKRTISENDEWRMTNDPPPPRYGAAGEGMTKFEG
jgi:hypothetical protein